MRLSKCTLKYGFEVVRPLFGNAISSHGAVLHYHDAVVCLIDNSRPLIEVAIRRSSSHEMAERTREFSKLRTILCHYENLADVGVV
jgi:hypothetical protein